MNGRSSSSQPTPTRRHAAQAALLHELRLFFVALQFLTRLPVPGWVGFEPAWLNRSARHFPLVGTLVGATGAAVAVAAQLVWPPVVAAALAVAATLWLTVAFHEDGLADSFDALLGAAPRDKALAIMKDSRIGSYGAAALLLVLLLRVHLLAELLARDPLLAAAAWVAAHTAGRAGAVALMTLLPYAGDEAHAKARPLAREVRRFDAAFACATGVVLLAVAAACPPAPPASFVAATAGLCLLTLILRNWLRARLGGYTGDTLGAAEQLGEVIVLLAFAA
ncbi:MAG TPA: adenosylcobinamide-GDP ribazoletransferase [Burkholderiaceae bacterium]|nr:adenosylcobinamide-GDP ribazoletransferase [Burkholderiaceae bacterium]